MRVIHSGESMKSVWPRLASRIGLDLLRGGKNLISGKPLMQPGFGSQTIESDDLALVEDVLSHPEMWDDESLINRLQDEFAAWNGSHAAFAFMGGRVALSACIHALGLRPGDEVVVPGYTCVVVPNAFAFAGVKEGRDIEYASRAGAASVWIGVSRFRKNSRLCVRPEVIRHRRLRACYRGKLQRTQGRQLGRCRFL